MIDTGSGAEAHRKPAAPSASIPDLGPHRGARSEWWYFTGRVVDCSDEEHFYVLAFFRSSLRIELSRFAHFLLHSRSGPGTACERAASPFGPRTRIQPGTLDLDYNGWAAVVDGGRFAIRAQQGAYALDLVLTAGSPLLPGREGRIDLGTIRTQCRSLPRLATEGTIRLGGRVSEVRGLSWFDHEWGALPLPHRWDWWGINLDNGADLVIRHAHGRGVANLRHADGRMQTTTAIRATPVRHWRGASGALYPIEWALALPELETDLEIAAEWDGCETPFHVRYWEGPCRVKAWTSGALVHGRGYMELVGYDSRMLRFVTSRLWRLFGDLVFRERSTDVGGTFPTE